jgi:hypothetical protein
MAVFDSICDTEINECLICKENNLNFHTPCCNQRMHEKCLHTWFKKSKNRKCPHCRQYIPIKYNYKLPIHLNNNNIIIVKIQNIIIKLEKYAFCKFILFPIVEISLIILIHCISFSIYLLYNLYSILGNIGFIILLDLMIFIIKLFMILISSITKLIMIIF